MREVREVVVGVIMAEKREEAPVWRVRKKDEKNRKKSLWKGVSRSEEEIKSKGKEREKRRETLVGVRSWSWQYNVMQWVPWVLRKKFTNRFWRYDLITKLPLTQASEAWVITQWRSFLKISFVAPTKW